MWLGAIALIASNIGVIGATFILRLNKSNQAEMLLLLGVGNAIAAVYSLIIDRRKTSAKSQRLASQHQLSDLALVAVWAMCNALIYIWFVRHSTLLNASHIIIAEILAPFLALAIMFRQWKQLTFRRAAVLIASVATLLSLVAHQGNRQDIEGQTWFYLLLMTVLFAVSQSIARTLSTRRSAAWTQLRLCAMVATCVLIGVAVMIPYDFLRLPTLKLWLGALALGVTILITQRTFLYGLKITPPIPSAVLIASSVPLAIAWDTIAGRASINMATAFLIVLYLALSYFSAKVPSNSVKVKTVVLVLKT